MKRLIFGVIGILLLGSLTSCGSKDVKMNGMNVETDSETKSESGTKRETESETEEASTAYSYILPEGSVISDRIRTPEGYARVLAEDKSLTAFLREYPLKEDKSPVLLYDGSEKRNQNAHAAVLKLPVEAEDLQQCADSVMRIYAEYFWQTNQQQRIAFHFVSGFLAEYEKWREGYRILVNGNDVSWVKSASYDDSYEAFAAYLRMVFAYAGTLSMEAESSEADLSEIRPGDVFLKGGSPGHVVMVLDVCENEEGRKAFLLGQGYMPAQEFHILKNPIHEENPWYYEEEAAGSLSTPEYTFGEGSFRHLNY